jgi:hypothetical protein
MPEDWFTDPNWHDENEIIDPGGAAAGPGAIAGGIPASLISYITNDAGTGPAAPDDPGPGGPFEVDYAELEKFATEHDLNAQELAQWASGDPDFPERYLATHGKVNFATYLKIKEFMISKQVVGNAFAEQQRQTSTALRAVVTVTQSTDEANAAAFRTTRMV